jgi:Holliday junction resolvase RusA-like endonuclease
MPADSPTLNAATPLTITVVGHPAPQGSKRHVGRGIMVEASKRLVPWRQDVKHAALEALAAAPWWDTDARAVAMHVVFAVPRPKYHYQTGKNASLLRAGAPDLVGVKPDLDKLLRSTCDALTAAGAYADDCRVAQIYAVKCYPGTYSAPARPGAHITLTAVDR